MPRQPPDVAGLLRLLDEHGVRYVVTGSGAAMLHGVDLVPGDLDVTPALDRENLERLAALLEAIGARPRTRAVEVDGVWIAALEDALATTRKHEPQLPQLIVSSTIGRGRGGSSASS